MRTRVPIRFVVLGWVLVGALVAGGCSSHSAPRAAVTDPTRTTVKRAPTRTTVTRVPTTKPLVPSVSSQVRAIPILSSYETPDRVVSRDIGLSVALPDGNDLWLFGDTRVDQHESAGTWVLADFIDGSTALETQHARGQVPSGREYPSATPSRLLPVPTNVYLNDGSGRACVKGISDAAFSARWPTGAALMPNDDSEVLVTYVEVCVTYPNGGSPQAVTEGRGYLLYNWRTQRIDRGPVDVVAPTSDGAAIPYSSQFGSPVFENGKLTLFSSHCVAQYLGCGTGQVWSTTMPATADALSSPASYTPHLLSSDADPTWEPESVSVARYPTGLRLIEWTGISGTYKILSAATLDSPWHLEESGELPGCDGHKLFCFALNGHPELSTAADLFVSYFDPDSGPAGHVVMSALQDRKP